MKDRLRRRPSGEEEGDEGQESKETWVLERILSKLIFEIKRKF